MSIWTSASDLSHKPLNGPEWSTILNNSNKFVPAQVGLLAETPQHCYALASAMAYVRTGEIKFKDPLVEAFGKLIGDGNPGGDPLLWARSFGSYVLAADLISLEDSAFDDWVLNASQVWTNSEGDTLLEVFQNYPNHLGALAFGSLCAAYSYLEDTIKFNLMRSYFVSGITGPDPGYTEWDEAGANDSWQLDRQDFRTINPDGLEAGIWKGGLIPETQLFGDRFGPSQPSWDDRIGDWISGAVMGAWILDRAGTPIWLIGGSALERLITTHEETWQQLKLPNSHDWVIPVLENIYSIGLNTNDRGLGFGPNTGFLAYHLIDDVLEVPYQVSVTTQSTNVALLEWQGSESSYDIEGKISGSPVWNIHLTAITNSLSVAGLASNTSYIFRVRSFYNGGYSEFSDEVSSITDLSTPVSLSAEELSDTNVRIEWVSTGPQNAVEWRLGEEDWQSLITENMIVVISGLVPDTEYDFRVRTYDGSRFSLYSSIVSAITEIEPPLEIPSPLKVVPLGVDGANLIWDYMTPGDIVFLVERNNGPNGWAEVGASGTPGFIDTELLGGVYNYRVRAFDKLVGSYSDYSNSVRVAIKKADVGPPPSIIPLTSSDVIPLEGPLTGELVVVPYISQEITSRFSSSLVYRDDEGNPYYGTYLFDISPHEDDDSYHTVQSGESGRLDLISYEHYNTVHLWWVIANANSVVHPIKDVTPGVVLRVPSSEKVYAEITRYKR